MSKECSLVKDLLPLYIENMVSEETASFIEEHLTTCPNCKELLNLLKVENDEIDTDLNNSTSNDKLILKKVKSKLTKKTILTIVISMLLTFVGVSQFLPYFTPKGDTIESRELILNKSVSFGKNWSIVKEVEIEDALICGAVNSSNEAAIAIFCSIDDSRYEFRYAVAQDSDEIIVSGYIINGKWYDLVWYNGAQTEYAELIYNIPGEGEKIFRFDTSNMDIIYNLGPANEYGWNVIYYDNQGNEYKR